jgi:hypothetical protein
MAKTGERYVAARRVLIEQATGQDHHAWISQPEQPHEAVLRGTGRGWDEWREQIDAWPGHGGGRAAVTRWLQEEHGLGGWWAMAVTLGWERITGRRLPHQRPDGTFSVTKSATINSDVVALREMLLDDADRRDLFPGVEVELRSRPTSKSIRLGMVGGTVELVLEPKAAGRRPSTSSTRGCPRPSTSSTGGRTGRIGSRRSTRWHDESGSRGGA